MKWIKCSDRLREDGIWCVVLLKADQNTDIYYRVGKSDKKYFENFSFDCDEECARWFYTITHWMPLPEKPE